MTMNAQLRTQLDTMQVPRLQVNLKLDPLRADVQLQRTLQLDASRSSSSSIDSNDQISAHARTFSHDSNSDTIYDTNPNDKYDTDSSISTDCYSILSDESGRFDDADEECSQSETPAEGYYNRRKEGKRHHAVSSRDSFLLGLSPKKRRRSNDRSLQAQSGHSASDKRPICRDESHAITSTGRFHAPALGGAPAGGGGIKAGRRSRFIEAMNDSASECEKPPSIFFQEGRTGGIANKPAGNAATHRQSGIFRFGKAIASAFSPFGVFGHKSDASKSAAQDANRQKLRDDALERAEKAYAELKKSGYKGTAKGSYLRQEREEKQRPQGDIKSMPEKAAVNADVSQGDGQKEVTTSAVQDRSGRTSSMSLASIIRNSHDSVRPEMRKQKSRKELHKQEKLLKRVSSLQEKLEKAQRELRELTGPGDDGNNADTEVEAEEHVERDNEDEGEEEEEGEVVEATVTEYIAPSEPPVQTYYVEPVFPKKFVPGALPSLPSERLLAQTESLSTGGDPGSPQGYASQSIHRGKKSQNDESIDEVDSGSNSKLSRQAEAPKPSAMTDSPSRKRKSPGPESTAARETDQSQTGDRGHARQEIKQSPRLPQSRRSKLQKHVRGDSPGSVEREREQRQHQESQPEPLSEKTNEATRKRSSRFLRPSSRSPAARLRRTSLSSLRMRKGTSGGGEFCIDREDLDQGEGDGDDDSLNENGAESQQQQKRNFYMQDQRRLDSNGPNAEAITAAKASTKTRANKNKNDNIQIIYDENIPPVPSLPKDLLANAAKINSKGATATANAVATRNGNANGKKGGRTTKTLRTMPSDEFRWPDEIF